jgi:UDP-N-acetylmuramoyl-L-alanyl-D-glutamate--2,6-diaminopimelate ligase
LQLREAIKDTGIIKIDGPSDIDIKGVTCDSKKIKNGFMFVAIKGNKLDGRQFVKEAIEKGAICVASEQGFIKAKGITNITVKDVRGAYAKICCNFYKNPSQALKVIGITGTNGKTTTAYLIQAILKKAGYGCGRITTIDYSDTEQTYTALNTTPDAGILQKLFSDMANKKLDYCVMEVSSQALHQQRTNSVTFYSSLFTNLSKEHLDYHKSIDEYFLCKKMLFDQLSVENFAFINIDDAYGKKLASLVKSEKLSYGFDKDADIRAENEDIALNGSRFLLVTPDGKTEISTPLVGRHNIYNVLAACSFALYEGISLEILKQGLSEFIAPLGRLEKINQDSDLYVYVDYAHTDDALENVLSTLLPLKKSRIITVFGCGGDRDKAKRPRMGKVAAKFSDAVIITSDNPRSENPDEIIKQIIEGIPKDFRNYFTIKDREEAIKKAIAIAKKGDIVLIAGKGHETTQIFKDRAVPFNEREIVRNLCLSLRK